MALSPQAVLSLTTSTVIFSLVTKCLSNPFASIYGYSCVSIPIVLRPTTHTNPPFFHAEIVTCTMRLLKIEGADDFSLVEFLGDLPRYAILSHTWGRTDEEVTYQDIVNGTGKTKKGYRKLYFCGRQAARDGLDHIWIDTCCIDKSSSAELSEAINSMYFWYGNAVICYAYLSDVRHVDDVRTSLESSKWFTRGWTLQEFLAPQHVEFYSAKWELIGDKKSLKDQLHGITKIPMKALEGTPLNHFSIAQRMSWASKRKTTRIEDMAYSLMGIFDVNMPLLYGEREKAFRRLQQHILQESNDHSIFAWKDTSLGSQEEVSIFAQSPAQFQHSGDIRSLALWSRYESVTVTQSGLRMEPWLIPLDDVAGLFVASLPCFIDPLLSHSPGIYIQRLTGGDSWNGDPKTQFVRIRGNELVELKGEQKVLGKLFKIHIRHEPRLLRYNDPIPLDVRIFTIGWEWNTSKESSEQVGPYTVRPLSSWDPTTQVFTTKQSSGIMGTTWMQHKLTTTVTVFGISPNGQAWISTVCRPSYAPDEGFTYKIRGNETAESQVVIKENRSGRVLCTSSISNSYHPITGRKMFVVIVRGKAAPPL